MLVSISRWQSLGSHAQKLANTQIYRAFPTNALSSDLIFIDRTWTAWQSTSFHVTQKKERTSGQLQRERVCVCFYQLPHVYTLAPFLPPSPTHITYHPSHPHSHPSSLLLSLLLYAPPTTPPTAIPLRAPSKRDTLTPSKIRKVSDMQYRVANTHRISQVADHFPQKSH